MKRKLWKKVAGMFTAIIVVIIGLSGCMGNILPEFAKDKALEYLNTKYSAYGDTFTPVSYFPGDWSDPAEMMTFKSKNYDDQIVTVYIHSNNGTSYTDDYFMFYMAEEVEQYFADVAKEHGITARVLADFNLSGAYEVVDAETTFEEYIKDWGNMYCCYFVKEPVEDEQAQALVKDIASRGITGNVYIYLYSNEEDVEAVIADEAFAYENLTRLKEWYIRDEENIDEKNIDVEDVEE